MMAFIFAGMALLLMALAGYSLMKKPKDAPLPVDGRRKAHRTVLLSSGAGIAAILLAVAVGVYAFWPLSLGQPRSSDISAATSPEALEKQLQQTPTAAGYKRLANMYFAAGQYEKAVAADHRAIDLGANDASTWSEFGESIVMASGGQVLPSALAAFTNAISRDPRDARARFYIGMAEAQIGNLKQAVAIWRDLEKDAAPNAKWLPMVRQHVAAFSKEGGFDPASIQPAAPSPVVLRLAVASMNDALQQRANAPPPTGVPPSGATGEDAMIRAMVERLATRMKASPNDADGWRRLAHAYNVLGEHEKARQAIAHAVRLKPRDPQVQLTLAETERAARPPAKK